MSGHVSFGDNGKINFSNLRAGLTRKDLGIEDAKYDNIWNSINVNNSEDSRDVIDKNELLKFIDKIKNLAGRNEKLSKGEAGKFTLGDNKTIGKKQSELLFKLLANMEELTKNVFSVNEERNIVTKKDKSEVEYKSDGTVVTTTKKDGVTTVETKKDDKLLGRTVVYNQPKDGKILKEAFDGNNKLKARTSKEDDYTYDCEYNEEGCPITAVRTYSDGKTATETYTYENNKLKKSTITYNDGTKEEYENDENGDYKTRTDTKSNGSIEKFRYDKNSNKWISFNVTENGKSTTVVTEGEGEEQTIITTVEEGNRKTVSNTKDNVTTTTVYQDGKPVSQTVGDRTVNYTTVDGQTYTTGVIVQKGESISDLAKKFGVEQQAIIDANQDVVRTFTTKNGKKVKGFLVGAKIVIPTQIEADNVNLQNRTNTTVVSNGVKKRQPAENTKKTENLTYKAELPTVTAKVIPAKKTQLNHDVESLIANGKLHLVKADFKYIASNKTSYDVFYGKKDGKLTYYYITGGNMFEILDPTFDENNKFTFKKTGAIYDSKWQLENKLSKELDKKDNEINNKMVQTFVNQLMKEGKLKEAGKKFFEGHQYTVYYGYSTRDLKGKVRMYIIKDGALWPVNINNSKYDIDLDKTSLYNARGSMVYKKTDLEHLMVMKPTNIIMKSSTGYKISLDKKGNPLFWDDKNNLISEDKFKEKCPNTHKEYIKDKK